MASPGLFLFIVLIFCLFVLCVCFYRGKHALFVDLFTVFFSFLPFAACCYQCNISNTRDIVPSGYPNTEKRVENTTRSGVFVTKFEEFG